MIARVPRRIAIACQGGGSHTAFTAGVLQSLLLGMDDSRHRIAGLSGTSGGALCAALAWAGLVVGDRQDGVRRLAAFWQDMAAQALVDAITNQGLVLLQRSREWFALPEVSPYNLPETGRTVLADLIDRHLPFAALEGQVTAQTPVLLAGAVEVKSGEFMVFSSRHPEPGRRGGRDALLASAARPELFRAMPVGDGLYWDGLFSQNPPVRGFVSGCRCRDDKPDEIWVVQINPTKRRSEPRTVREITDRRNELAGNLSLAQELFFIEQINDWLSDKLVDASAFKPITVRRIELARELDYPSKLDRSPAFIAQLMADGRQAGADFLAGLPAA